MKANPSSFPLLLITFSLLLTLPACTPNPNEEFIQGNWAFVNESGDYRPGRPPLYFQWNFYNGTFYVEQEVFMGFPRISEGHYRILDSEEDKLTIELYDVQGNYYQYEPVEVDIQLDRENNTLRISKALFEHVGP